MEYEPVSNFYGAPSISYRFMGRVLGLERPCALQKAVCINSIFSIFHSIGKFLKHCV